MSSNISTSLPDESNKVALNTPEELELLKRIRDSRYPSCIELVPDEFIRLALGLQPHNRFILKNSPYPDRRQFYYGGVIWLMELPSEKPHE